MHMRHVVGWILLFFLCCTTAYAEEPVVGAQAAALIDGSTGRLLWGKNAEDSMVMASTTKIMTAIVVLENGDMEDVVTVSKNAAHQPEVHMDLREGEQWRVKDLLSAMMLRSYNDTAVALAEHVAGSVEAFCAQMTEKAAALGAVDTVFGTPNGLDSHLTMEEHHSTARDMAIITAYALKNPEFCRIVGQEAVNITEVNGKRQCDVSNADRFLREYEGAMGVKTGYTNKAGHCFVGAAERNGIRLVSTVLASGWGSTGKEKKWSDTKAIMDYGFATFSPFTVVSPGDNCGSVDMLHSNTTAVETYFSAGYDGLFSAVEQEKLEVRISLPETLEAPVYAGEQLGVGRVVLEDTVLAELPILAKDTAPAFTLSDWLRLLVNNWTAWC